MLSSAASSIDARVIPGARVSLGRGSPLWTDGERRECGDAEVLRRVGIATFGCDRAGVGLAGQVLRAVELSTALKATQPPNLPVNQTRGGPTAKKQPILKRSNWRSWPAGRSTSHEIVPSP